MVMSNGLLSNMKNINWR